MTKAAIYPLNPPRVVVYEVEYEWTGPEGDQTCEPDTDGAYRKVIFCVPDKWDREEGKTAADLAVDVMNDQPAYLEPDCVPGIPSWFCGMDNDNRRAIETGNPTEYSVHLYGFNALQRSTIGRKYAAR